MNVIVSKISDAWDQLSCEEMDRAEARASKRLSKRKAHRGFSTDHSRSRAGGRT